VRQLHRALGTLPRITLAGAGAQRRGVRAIEQGFGESGRRREEGVIGPNMTSDEGRQEIRWSEAEVGPVPAPGRSSRRPSTLDGRVRLGLEELRDACAQTTRVGIARAYPTDGLRAQFDQAIIYPAYRGPAEAHGLLLESWGTTKPSLPNLPVHARRQLWSDVAAIRPCVGSTRGALCRMQLGRRAPSGRCGSWAGTYWERPGTIE